MALPTRKWALAALFLVLLPFSIAATAAESGPVTLRVGYIPIMPMSQLFVMEGEGWVKDAGLNLKLTRFSSGPAMIQALASGTLDVAYIGIGPAMVSRAKGVPIKVVASNVYDQMAVIAGGSFAKIWSEHPGADALAAFQKAHGRKLKIATMPKGSVPDTVLRYWIQKRLGAKLDQVEIVGMGASAIQQGLLAGSVDAASIMEPILTIVGQRLPDSKVIVRGDEMLPDHPGAVVAVMEPVIAAHPEAVDKLVQLHVRATKLLNEQPDRSAKYLAEYIGKGLLPVELLAKSLKSPSTGFVANPHKIKDGTRRLYAYEQEIGVVKQQLDLDQLFDNRFFDNVTASK